MNPISKKIQINISKIVEDLFSLKSIIEVEIGIPKEASFGNLSSSVSFQISKEINSTKEKKLSPSDIAFKIIAELEKYGFTGKFTNIAGYINYTYSNEDLIIIFQLILQSQNEGNIYNSQTFKNKTFSLEYISPNSTKSLHLGHLMNASLGKSIYNLLINSGANVRREILFNDRGIGMGKLMYAFEKYETKDPRILQFISEKNELPLLDTLYLWGSIEYENDEKIQSIVSNKVVQWEKEMTEYNEQKRRGTFVDFSTFQELALWDRVRQISLDTQKKTIGRLKCEYDQVWYESDFFDLGQNIATNGYKNNIFRESEGALLTNLKSYNLTDTIVRKSDGTALYITQDLALAQLKKRDLPENSKYLYIVGNEQKLALQQLFAVCDQLNINKINSFIHISYPFILLKGKGKMSSRKGNTVFIDELIDEVKSELKSHNQDLSDVESEKLAISAIKFSFLKYSRTSEIHFDIEDSINTTGFSAIYIMYAYARTASLLKNIPEIDVSADISDIDFNDSERNLLIEIQNMNIAISQATAEFAPNKICYSLFEIANKFNKFYAENRILDAEDTQKTKRILLAKIVNKSIEESFNLLGIEVISRM